MPKKNEREKKAEKPEEKSLWEKCPACDQIIYGKELEENLKICPKCHAYLRMNARERIALLVDRKNSGELAFEEMDADLTSVDSLHFYGDQGDALKTSYTDKLAREVEETGNCEALISGAAVIEGQKAILAVMNFEFMGGSMGSVVGEKVTRAIERATDDKCAVVIVSASGGARMQEGILSLMQMAKTSAALARHHDAGLLCIVLLCDPTTGGVTASFAMLGDILVAEPKALIAFAGPRVIEQTIRQKLPQGFQQAEFAQKHGMVDIIVERKDLKSRLAQLIQFFKA